ncbi:MAG: acyltransferase [Anaerolineales bacterium]|jgi:maltose O-acetyltransferase|nr:hypothetical protein [Anaerolineaceae bacterium]MDP6225847.1 acyltransferase [Anaerolineales bacterium]MDP7345770.1 acyltransferase [Anaerolineales bacterium]MDP7544970.1 acyltransferase [Anaerolineales bacterium]MDP7643199.1 acyltransferase [Anaerolineales bacterium]|tara:strand:- start:3133 stop:3705 length:573 start_codon:yes stop_codon:yes gene_type:complete
MLKALRSWFNRKGAVPMVGFLRTWVLNVVISNVPCSAIRNAYYRQVCGISIGEGTEIWSGVRFAGGAIDKVRIGAHCSIPHYAFFVAGEGITIGDHVVFGHAVELYTSDHDPDDPAFSRRDAPIMIHTRAWIGSRAVILKGVIIGEGAVVAAGSVVTRDVQPFTIVGGNPARVIRERGTREFTYQAGRVD